MPRQTADMLQSKPPDSIRDCGRDGDCKESSSHFGWGISVMNWPLMALWMAGSEQRTSASCYRCKSVGVYMCVGKGCRRRKRERKINK